MPELPEVQTVVDDLMAVGLLGARICKTRVFWSRSVDRPDRPSFCRILEGLHIQKISRRAKYIVLTLTEGWTLLVHLRMTGRLTLSDGNVTEPGPHDRIILQLNGGRELRFTDTRKFGRFYLTARPDDILGRLGPEPLGKTFTTRTLFEMLHNHAGRLKPLLLNQQFIAGLGNIYVDEALWEARLHPCHISNTLSLKEAGSLHRAIRKVLRSGLDHLGTSLGQGQTNFFSVSRRRGANQHNLKVFRQAGAPCPCCSSIIVRLRVAQRSTFICPSCQSNSMEAP